MVDLNSLPLPPLFEELTADGCLHRLVAAAFAEDLAVAGDITTESVIAPEQRAKAALVLRRPGVIAGLAAVHKIVESDASLQFDGMVNDGDAAGAAQTVATISGDLWRILALERIILNLLGRLCGVATLTRQYFEATAGTNAVICDTRKTTPGMRNLEKYAVRCGGGTMHRLGLFDAALFKDNHLAGIAVRELGERLTNAIRSMRSRHEVRFVEVEVDNLDQLRAVLNIEAGLVDMILLDNMTPEIMREAAAMRKTTAPSILLEASGGVSLQRIRAIAETGVDRISVGAITHSAPWLDVGLDIE